MTTMTDDTQTMQDAAAHATTQVGVSSRTSLMVVPILSTSKADSGLASEFRLRETDVTFQLQLM
jgi:hypothetical protein